MNLISKLQKGGGFDDFFYVYQPVFAETKTAEKQSKSSKAKDDSKGKLTEKDLYSMLKDLDGLPNEVDALVRSISNTLQLSTINGSSTSNLANLYVKILGRIKKAKFNKDQYDAAYKESEKNGSLNDYAITPDGGILVQTPDEEISVMSPQLYIAERGSGKLERVTNSNLLWLRARDPSFVNNNRVFLIIENGIGLDKIHDEIKDRSAKLGNTSNSSETYLSKDIIAGNLLLQLAIGKGPDGYYKWKLSLTQTEDSQIQMALNYIYNTLPANARTRLALETEHGTQDEVASLIGLMLVSGTSRSINNSFDYIANASKNGGSEGKGIDDDVKASWLTGVQLAEGGETVTRDLIHGGQGQLSVEGKFFGGFLDLNGNAIDNLTLQDLLTKTGLLGITNTNSIVFGDNVLNSNTLNYIAIQNTGGIRAALPCKKGPDGTKIPDFELIDLYDQAVKEIMSKLGDSATHEQMYAALEKEINSNPKYEDLKDAIIDFSGHIDQSRMGVFFIVDGLASDINFTFTNDKGKAIKKSNSNPYIPVDEDKNDIAYFKAVVPGMDKFDEYSHIGEGLIPWIDSYNTLYKGNVFIPINTSNRLSAIIFSKLNPKESTATLIEKESLKKRLKDNENYTGSDALWK